MIDNKNQVGLIWAILCQNVSVDAKTNAVSLFNILEEIQVAIPEEKKVEFATLNKEGVLLSINSVLSIYMKNLTDKKDLEVPIKLEISDPNGKHLGGDVMAARFEGKLNHRVFVSLNMFKATVSGKYTFKISAQELNSSSYSEIGSAALLLHIS